MSKYTTEVRYICETYAGLDESVGYDHINEVIAAAQNQIFDSVATAPSHLKELLSQAILLLFEKIMVSSPK